MRIFETRHQAGVALAAALERFRGTPGAVVLGLPRGGVPVARAVATALSLPCDVLLVRKLGVPWQPELAFGAISEGNARVVDHTLAEACGISQEKIAEVVAREEAELKRRAEVFRGSRALLELRGVTVILVDDGLATGSTMQAAVRATRERGAGRVVVAVPVGSRQACQMLRGDADEVVCLETPEPFEAVGQWFVDFHQMTDQEVLDIVNEPPTGAGPA